jgi:hypothetical protein
MDLESQREARYALDIVGQYTDRVEGMQYPGTAA